MNRAKALALVVFPIVAAAPGWAVAQQGADFRPGFYLGGTVGQSDAKDACPGCDDTDTAWRVFGGYQFTRNLGVEAGYHDFGSFSSNAAIGGLPAGQADAKAAEIMAVGTFPINQWIGLYGKAGAYRYDVDNSATGLSDKGTELTYGAGLRYNFTRNIAGRLEWQRYTDMGAVSAAGTSDVDVYSLGIQVQF